jgi:alanyl aminopeptidase
LRSIAAPRFARLTDTAGAGEQLLRERLQRFLVVIANDRSMREPLAKRAAAVVGLDGKPDPAAAPPSEFETIFGVGVQDIGEPFFDLLLERAIASEDPAFRNSAIGALALAEDPVVVKKLQDAVLAGKFKGTEMLQVVSGQMKRGAARGQTYAWLQENDEAIIAMVPESFRSNVVPSLGGAFCSDERADEWQRFVTSHADELPGYERDLAQTIEGIRLCAALRQANAAELIAAFGNYR